MRWSGIFNKLKFRAFSSCVPLEQGRQNRIIINFYGLFNIAVPEDYVAHEGQLYCQARNSVKLIVRRALTQSPVAFGCTNVTRIHTLLNFVMFQHLLRLVRINVQQSAIVVFKH